MRNIYTFGMLFLCWVFCWLESAQAEAPTFKVGMLLPLSGAYAAVGEDNRRGIEQALKESNNQSLLRLVYADSRAEPNQAISEFRKLTNSDKVSAVFAFRGPVGMAISPISKTKEVPILGGVGNKDFASANEFAFQLWPRSDYEGRFVAKQIANDGARRLALLTTEDDWTVSVSRGVQDHAQEHGIEVVFSEEFPPSEMDFRTLLAKLEISAPDAVFANVALGQIGTLLKQVRALKIDIPIYSNFWAAKPEVLSLAGDAMEGVRYVEMNTQFPNFSGNASGATLSAYVATNLLIQAASDAAVLPTTPSSFYQALKEQKEVRTRSGNFAIRDRCVEFPLMVKIIRNGKPEVFKASRG